MTCVRTWIKKQLLNKMENKELKEKSLPTEQVTTTEKKTKPKDPGRIAAGKNLQNITKKREKQKRLAAKIKKFQKKTKMKFQKKTIKKDHFH